MLPTWFEWSSTCSRRTSSARWSRTGSWLPVTRMDSSAWTSLTLRVTGTVSPASYPSSEEMMRRYAFDLTALICTPDPLERGVATHDGPIRPTERSTNSSVPASEWSVDVSRAEMMPGSGTGIPEIRTSGVAISLSTVRAERGYPGIPSTGMFPIFPSMTGFPGLMATPWTSTSPSSAITSAV